jgi:hypothetical protein
MSLTTSGALLNVLKGNFGAISSVSSLVGATQCVIEATASLDVTASTYNNLTVLTVINTNAVGGDTITITTTNLTEDAAHDYIYVQNPPGSSVTIAPQYKRIFIRVMFSPSVWEPSASIAV